MAKKFGNTVRIENSSMVKIGSEDGHTIINKNSPLRRLNYFDGKFLRAPDLILEQQALLNQIRISNQAGGFGVVHGYDTTLGNNDSLSIGGGFAIDPQGRVLLLNTGADVSIGELIEKSRSEFGTISRAKNSDKNTPHRNAAFDDCVVQPTSSSIISTENSDLYIITVNHAEAYCGEEDVYGKLCSEACSTSTNRSYVIEGIEFRAIPLDLSVLYKNSAAVDLSQKHLRSRVASAYFEQERQLITSHISADGLKSSIWCFGAEAASGNGVPIAILGRSGSNTLFLDTWTARRERMEAPPRHYWAGRMAMRAWKVYLAQILQFQCQLRGCLTSAYPSAPCKKITDFDPCADTRKVAGAAADGMRYLIDSLSKVAERIAESNGDAAQLRALIDYDGGLTRLEQQYQNLIDATKTVVPNRLLINCGIVEVPSAGYLPINASSTVTVNEQVQRLLGEGVDLRFCVVRPDFIPHALEEAQHMERICLLSGLDNPENKPKVDVLVPDGEIQRLEAEVLGSGYQAKLAIHEEAFEIGWPRKTSSINNQKQKEIKSNDGSQALGIVTNLQALSNLRAAQLDLSSATQTLSGAARGEKTDNGGLTFYLAAKNEQQLTMATSILATANQSAQQVLQLFNGDTNTSASTGDVNAKAAAEKERQEKEQQEKLSSGLHINTNNAVNVNSGQSVSSLVPSSALWVSLKTERDPFTLNSGASTDLRGKVTMALVINSDGRQRLTIAERTVNGQLHITRGAEQKADTKISARFVGDGIWTDTRVIDGNAQERSEPVRFDENVTISRTTVTGLPATISIAITNPSFFAGLDNVQLVFQRVWVSPTESKVTSLLRYQTAGKYIREQATDAAMEEIQKQYAYASNNHLGREILLADGYLVEDSAVLKPGNSSHSLSLNALSTIGKVSGDKSFVDQAAKRLFPAVEPIPQELRILAKRPWVLFHRRRDKVCEQAVAEQVEIKPRRYRVYHIHLEQQIDTAELVKALEADTSGVISKFKANPVGVIDYAPGIATVTTTHTDVRADWKAAVKVDADVHVGIIASAGDVLNEGETLADARLQSLTDVLAPVSEAADDFTLLSVNQVPPTLASGEVDGAIIYFTKAVSTICHSVFRFTGSNVVVNAVLERLSVYLQKEDSEPLAAFAKRLGFGTLAVNPRFIGGTDQYYGENEAAQVSASWDLLNDGPVTRLVSIGANETDEQQLITRQQTAHISQSTGTTISADSATYMPAVSNLLTPCPKASVLIAETICNEVYFLSQVRQGNSVVESLIDAIKGDGLTREMLVGDGKSTLFNRFGAVDFYQDSSDFETESRQQFSLQWQTELGGTSPGQLNGFYVMVVRTGANDEETNANYVLAEQQGTKLRELMGINTATVVAATNNPNVEFPSDCRVLTILVVAAAFSYLPNYYYQAMALWVHPEEKVTDSTTPDDTATAAKPELALKLAKGVKFDSNNEVIRDAAFNAAIAEIASSGKKIKNIEVVSMKDAENVDADARAKSLLKILKEEGAANNTAKVVTREANATEKVEIVRSGFALEGGMVFK